MSFCVYVFIVEESPYLQSIHIIIQWFIHIITQCCHFYFELRLKRNETWLDSIGITIKIRIFYWWRRCVCLCFHCGVVTKFAIHSLHHIVLHPHHHHLMLPLLLWNATWDNFIGITIKRRIFNWWWCFVLCFHCGVIIFAIQSHYHTVIYPHHHHLLLTLLHGISIWENCNLRKFHCHHNQNKNILLVLVLCVYVFIVEESPYLQSTHIITQWYINIII